MSIKRGLIFLIFTLLVFKVNVTAASKAVVDITKMDISSLSEALDLNLITSEELVNLYLERINTYDKDHNSIITLNEKAIEEAKRLDKERAKGSVRSVLHGIPIVVKDNIDVEGMPTTAGAKALKDNYPKKNAFVIQKLIDAGAIILAKTNMSEFAFYASSSVSSYGTVTNAFNKDYSAYGSSGGSAVAVASAFAAAALGTDTNSSVRLPASANNVVGLRPSLGLVSRTGVLPYDMERDTVGPITSTIKDTTILMNIMGGYDETDSKSINETKDYQITAKNLEGVVLGVPTKFMTGSSSSGLPENKSTYSEIIKLMEDALAKMEAAGASIVYIDEYYTYKTDGWYNNSLSGFTFCSGFNKYAEGTTGKIRTFSQLANASGKITGLDGYLSSCGSALTFSGKDNLKNEYRDYVNGIMTENSIDVIVYPSSKNKLLKNSNTEGIMNLSAHAPSTINYPAITMPLGFDTDNLAYGIEFMAPTNKEELLFNIAAIYESVNPQSKLPEISPALYTVPAEVEKLITNYKIIKESASYSFETNWLADTQKYFRSYSENENVESEAESLNLKYATNKYLAVVLTGLLFLVKWFLIIVGGFIALLLIRKIIRRAFRKRKRRRKR